MVVVVAVVVAVIVNVVVVVAVDLAEVVVVDVDEVPVLQKQNIVTISEKHSKQSLQIKKGLKNEICSRISSTFFSIVSFITIVFTKQ